MSPTKATRGNAHVLINDAGVLGESKPALALPRESFDRTMAINFVGVVNGMRAFLQQILSNNEGAIVNVASIFGLVGVPNGTAYCSSKFAVRGFSEALTIGLMPTPVTVHTICPGGIKTNIAGTTDLGRAFAERYLETSPDDVARRIVQVISDNEPLLVLGHQSARIYWLSRFAPPWLKNKLLFKELASKLLETDEYRHVPCRR